MLQMLRLVALTAVAALAAAVPSNVGSGAADFEAPRYTLDLDLPPQQRWKAMCLAQIRTHGWENAFGPVFKFINTVVPADTWVKYDAALQAVAIPVVGSEMTNELRGIQAAALEIGQKVQLSELLFFQIFYEILMQCTGILARDPLGVVFHGRNMDIGLITANITATVTWTKGGEALMTTTQYLGYVGVHTGMRRGGIGRKEGWSVQANERVALVPGPSIGYKDATLLATILAFAEGHQTVGGFIRNIMLKAPTFEQAIPLLSNTPLASPMYLIVGGRDRGAVLTRDRKGLTRESQDTNAKYNTGGRLPVPPSGGNHRKLGASARDPWYLLQTNWDPWIPQTHWGCDGAMVKYSAAEEAACENYIKNWYADLGGCNDLCQLYSDGRSENATKSMGAWASRDADPEHLMSALSLPPVLNGGTRFTSIMSPAVNHYTTLVRAAAVGCGGVSCQPPDLRALRFLVQTMGKAFLPKMNRTINELAKSR